MKRTWKSPYTDVQTFTPNDYVAVCYRLACTVNGPDEVSPQNGVEVKHDATGCGEADHGQIQIRNGKIIGIWEWRYNQSGGTWHKASIWSPESIETTSGTAVTWTNHETSDSTGAKIDYHHKGVITALSQKANIS